MARNALFSLAFAALFSAAPGFSAAPNIGLATAVGTYSLNEAAVTGTADVFDGTDLRTTMSPSDVHLASGTDVRLATRSEGMLFSDHLDLRDGAVRVSHFDGYPVRAGQLQIEPDTSGAEAVVRLKGRTVEIASLGGTVKVTDGGALFTRVAAGTRISFQNATTATPAQSGASPAQPAATPNATPAQSGANPAPRPGPMSDKKAILWAAGICAVGGLVVGLIAAAQGKSPF